MCECSGLCGVDPIATYTDHADEGDGLAWVPDPDRKCADCGVRFADHSGHQFIGAWEDDDTHPVDGGPIALGHVPAPGNRETAAARVAERRAKWERQLRSLFIKPRAWQVTEAMLLADAEVAAVKASWPPDGWFAFGSHVDCGWIPLEFSDDLDECGDPLWERPAPPLAASLPVLPGPDFDATIEQAERLDDAIWRLRIDELDQYDIQRIVRVAVLPNLAPVLPETREGRHEDGPCTWADPSQCAIHSPAVSVVEPQRLSLPGESQPAEED